MAQMIAHARHITIDPLAYARTVIVGCCAMALIAAGQALPL